MNYATRNGTATTASGDYGAASGQLTFAPGETVKTITVLVNGDGMYEDDETFFVDFTPVSGQVVISGSGTGTITNDDPLPTVSISNVTAAEGNSGTTPFTFTVTLSNPTDRTVTVHYATVDDTAVAGDDYQTKFGTLTFNPGVTSQTVTVLVNGDNVYESDEQFHLELSGAVNAIIPGGGTTSATGKITNDDPLPTLSIGNVTVVEGNSGTTAATYTLTLSNPSSQPVTIAYATADGTAEAGSDYVAASGTVTFAPGDTVQYLTIHVKGDVVYENDETYLVQVSSPDASALVPNTQAIGTILNDDAMPGLTIDNVTQAEGTGGVTAFTFTVRLSGPSQSQVTVDYATVDGTAHAGSDYTAKSGQLIFAPGQTQQTVSILVTADNTGENDETFAVELSHPIGATITSGIGTGTIVNDDNSTDLAVTITDEQNQLGQNRSTTYSVVVTNRGPSGVTGARVLQSLTGADLTSVTWTAVSTGGAISPVAGNGPIDHFVDLPVGGTILYTVRVTVSPTATGSITNTVTVTPPSGMAELVPADNTASDTDKLITRLVAVGAGDGGGPHVRVYNSDGTLRFSFYAFESTQRGGVTVATGDVNGDGVDDVIVGAGVGGGPRIRVFDGITGANIADFFAYEDTQRGGVFVAAGDLDGDGRDEIIAGAGMGGGPRVRVFDGMTGNPSQGLDFFAYDSSFRNGVRVAAGDTNGDGKAEIVTGAGDNGSAHVRVWQANSLTGGVSERFGFFAYDPNDPQYFNGVYVAVGDVNGDGYADIITGPGSGGSPLVRVFNGKSGVQMTEFLAYDYRFRGGVRVSGADNNGDGISDSILASAGGIGGGQVRSFRLASNGTMQVEESGFVPYDPSYDLGVYVG